MAAHEISRENKLDAGQGYCWFPLRELRSQDGIGARFVQMETWTLGHLPSEELPNFETWTAKPAGRLRGRSRRHSSMVKLSDISPLQ